VTPVPEPIRLVGEGNAVVDIDKWEGPALIHIVGKQGQNFDLFSVKGGDDSFYVGSFEPYDGIRLMDFLPGIHTKKLEISAVGDWTIEIFPISPEFIADRLISSPEEYVGNGDDVLFIESGEEYRAQVKGNSASMLLFSEFDTP
jgi:hypothetical protein